MHGPARLRLDGQVRVLHLPGADVRQDNAGVVVWLAPLGAGAAPPAPTRHFRMAQKSKKFVPHLLVIPVGSTVDFPNFDPFFHNVFSLGGGQPFDLLLYQAGGSRSHRFTRAGVSYIFCNIHPQMSGFIIAVPGPWYAISRGDGSIGIADVPPGDYELHVWYERARPADLAKLQRRLHLTADLTLPPFSIHEIAAPSAHKNKYGQDYGAAPAGNSYP